MRLSEVVMVESDLPPHSIDVIGVGEDGRDGLSTAALEALSTAEVVIGGRRHHNLAGNLKAKRFRWPSPFSAMVGEIGNFAGKRVAILVTGDPLWYSAGALIARNWPPEILRFHPQLSAFQLASCRMKWSLADVETLTVHGRPTEQIVPWLSPGIRLIVLTADAASPEKIARLLVNNGYSCSVMTVLGALGGKHESKHSGVACDWHKLKTTVQIPEFHTLCIECVPDHDKVLLPRGPGLPDNIFETDGNFTKSEVRAITVCALHPGRGKMLWDLGCGHGTVAIEWMRVARDAKAIGVEKNAKRASLAAKNAIGLGAPRFEVRCAVTIDVIKSLPNPDSVFIGGGLSRELVNACISRLGRHGRLVVNAVTLENQHLVSELYALHGGELVNISIARCEPLGPQHSWAPQKPVVQWRLTR